MAANQIVRKIHDVVQMSGLHFVINQTPFSSYITIRRRFISPDDQQTVESNNITEDQVFKSKLDEMKVKLEKMETENTSLQEDILEREEELKIVTSEANKKLENVHAFADKLSKETSNLKETIVKLNTEAVELREKQSNYNKMLKSKEKEIHNLTKSLENFKIRNINLKEERNLLKNEKAKSEAEMRKLEQK